MSKGKCWCFTLNRPTSQETLDPDFVDYAIVGDEVGEGGTRHFQGYARFKKVYRLNQVKAILPRAHWEIAKGTPWQNFVYCSKDGQFMEIGTRPTEPANAHKKKKKDTTYDEVRDSETVAEGLKIVRTKRPRDYFLHGETIERNLKRQKKTPYKGKFGLNDFNTTPMVLDKPCLLWGPSNVGKTQFACAHFTNPLVVSHIDRLKELSPDNDAIIFDDMSFKHWPVEAVIHLLDTELERQINVRYGTITIPANTTKVFTHNTRNPFYKDEEIGEEQKEAIERRLQRRQVINKLY